MEANESWDHFLEAYSSMKHQRDSLVNMTLHLIDVLERDGYKQQAEFIRDRFKRFKNGDSFSNSLTRNENQPQE